MMYCSPVDSKQLLLVLLNVAATLDISLCVCVRACARPQKERETTTIDAYARHTKDKEAKNKSGSVETHHRRLRCSNEVYAKRQYSCCENKSSRRGWILPFVYSIFLSVNSAQQISIVARSLSVLQRNF
jgi:hypothetical protein